MSICPGVPGRLRQDNGESETRRRLPRKRERAGGRNRGKRKEKRKK